ncbi:MAG: efflux RND transporter periplasmic adaptor subunit, partial [Patescibacteria group bacterium]|nr:efflux RND transporter periplasmic adaptor subunit [Patescibacteria group bacterium]
ANVEGRDVGSVTNEIESKIRSLQKDLPEGYKIVIRGEAQSMKEGFNNLGLGLILAILLVYLVIMPLLRSFRLPFIIISVIPLGLIGVVAILLLTHTNLNIQSMMGIIMMVGITVAYSNLLVDKMNNLLKEGKELEQAIKEGVSNRFRPIIMTAIVTVLALTPMAIGYEIGGEADVPLARAIIGGVLAATFLSLFVVPILFYLLNKKTKSGMKINQMYILVPLILSFMTSCTNKKIDETVQAQEVRNIPTVLVTTPQQHQFNVSLQISGVAKPNQKVTLFAMVNGMLGRVNADIGDFVKQGQVLAILDNPDLIQQKVKAEADLREKKSVYQRLKGVYEKTPQLTTIEEVEKAQADYESADATFKALTAQVDYLQIQAPFAGIIVNRFVDKGAIIQSGLNNANAMPLFEIQDLHIIRLEVDIAEADATLIDKNTKVEIIFPELPNSKYASVVSRSAYSLNENTRTMQVEIDLPNADMKIHPEMYAKVTISREGHKDVLSLPNEAIGNLKGQSYVYVVDNNKVKKVLVTIGLHDDKFSEVLNANIKSTDKVVIQGKEFCSDGGIVEAKEITTQK